MRLRTGAIVALLLTVMAGWGYGTYALLGHYRHAAALRETPSNPVTVAAALKLPGSLYLVQDGDLYLLRDGAFTRLAAKPADGMWTMPSLTAGGRLLAVMRGNQWSDVELLDRSSGAVIGRLTSDNAGKRTDGSWEFDHWAFYPRAAADGSTVVFSYDSPKCGYNTALAVWSMPLPAADAVPDTPPTPRPLAGCPETSGLPSTGVRLTTPNQYTGGDVMPLPVAAGGLLFVRYAFDNAFHVHSSIWYQRSARDPGAALTNPDDDCSEPALAPDQTTLAMVCAHGGQTASLETVTLSVGGGATVKATPTATVTPLRTLVTGSLVAFPVWAPDGSGLAYLAPATNGGNFQLWWLAGALNGAGSSAQAVTGTLAIDATSPMAWAA